jgi:hypothetical protein
MEQDRSGTEWISEFLEWTFGESDRSLAELRAHADAMTAIGGDGEFANAYLGWIDATPVAAAARPPFAYDRRGVASEADRPGASREGILLMALRAEVDCVHMLRQVLEADGAAPGALQLALEGLEEAQRLLEGEQRAWHAMIYVREAGWTTPQALGPVGFEREWPAALDSVAAGVRALAGKVLEMHPR